MILYINACVREESRTHRLARRLLRSLEGSVTSIELETAGIEPLHREVLNRRESLIKAKCFEDPMFDLARQFAAADTIVIAAPYWDSTFPALLRAYIEHIYVTGLVTRYVKGKPQGLCRARELYYVTTAGGPYDPRFSYDYLKEMATRDFGIPEVKLLAAERMDMGRDPEELLEEAARAAGLPS